MLVVKQQLLVDTSLVPGTDKAPFSFCSAWLLCSTVTVPRKHLHLSFLPWELAAAAFSSLSISNQTCGVCLCGEMKAEAELGSE